MRSLTLGTKAPGTYEERWDAKDDAGTAVPDGTYTVLLEISNATQNLTRSCSVIVDNVAPATSISFSKPPLSDGSYEKGVKFSLDGFDAGSGVASYLYSVNGGEWKKWCSPVALNDIGQYTIKYKAIDQADNYNIQTTTVTVRATSTPTPAPSPTCTPAPTPVPTPRPSATPAPTVSPVPWRQTFNVNPGSVSVHDGGLITYETGSVQSLIDDRLVGGYVGINLTRAPDNAGLDLYVLGNPEAAQASQFKLAVLGSCGAVQDYAGVLVVDHPTLANGADITGATITMKVSRAWVDSRGGADAVKILRYSDGVAEKLDTSYVGTEGDLMVFRAISPRGLSTFALAALSAPAAAIGTQADQPGIAWALIGVLAIVAAIFGTIVYVVAFKQENDRRTTEK